MDVWMCLSSRLLLKRASYCWKTPDVSHLRQLQPLSWSPFVDASQMVKKKRSYFCHVVIELLNLCKHFYDSCHSWSLMPWLGGDVWMCSSSRLPKFHITCRPTPTSNVLSLLQSVCCIQQVWSQLWASGEKTFRLSQPQADKHPVKLHCI